MSNQLSPGINIIEKDYTQVVIPNNNVVTTGAFIGNFEWGPVNEPVLINTEKELTDVFGKPNEDNFESFFTAADYLDYSNRLLVQRVGSNDSANASDILPGTFENLTIKYPGTRFFDTLPALVTPNVPVGGVKAAGTLELSGGAITKGCNAQEGSVYLASNILDLMSDFTDLTQITFSQPEIPTLIDSVTGLPAFDYPVAFPVNVSVSGRPEYINVTHGGSGYLTQPRIIIAQTNGGNVTTDIYMPWDVLLNNITEIGDVGVASTTKVYCVKTVAANINGNHTQLTDLSSINYANYVGTDTTLVRGGAAPVAITDSAAMVGDIVEIIGTDVNQIKTILTTDGGIDNLYDNLIIEVFEVNGFGDVVRFKIRNPGSGYKNFPLITANNSTDKIFKYTTDTSTTGSLFYNFATSANNEFQIYNDTLTTPTVPLSGIYLPFAASITVTGSKVFNANVPEKSTNVNDVANFATINAGDTVYGVYIENAGDGYVSNPTFTNANAEIVDKLDGKIKPELSYISSVTLTNGGNGYEGGGIAFTTNPAQTNSADRVIFEYDFVNGGAKILNKTDFVEKFENGDLATYGAFLAKYPGKKGNSLRVSMCDSSSYISTLSGTINTKATPVLREDNSAARVAFVSGGDHTELSAVLNNIITNEQQNNLGVLESVNSVDYVKATFTKLSTAVQKNFRKLEIGDNVTVSGTANVSGTISDFGCDDNGLVDYSILYIKLTVSGKAAIATLTSGSKTLTFDVQAFTITGATISNINRIVFVEKCKYNLIGSDLKSRWKYADLFSSAIPGTSEYTLSQGGSNDELNVVIVDESGEFTGRKGQVLKRYQGLSKGFDAKVKSSGKNNYYKDVINAGPWVWAVNSPSIVDSINVATFGILSDDLTALPGETIIDAGISYSVSLNGTLTIASVSTVANLTVYFTTDQGATIYKKFISDVYIENGAEFDIFFNASLLNNTPVNVNSGFVDFGSSVKNNTFKSLKFPYDSVLVGGLDVLDADVTTLNYKNAYDNLVDPNKTNIDLIMTGIQPQPAIEYAITDVAEIRKDCIVCFSGPKTIGNTTANITKLVNFAKRFPDSSYAVMDSSWKYRYDKYNDKYRWIPMNGDTAGICARTDHTSDPWFSPGGFNRGVAKNVVKLALDPTEAQRDELYKASINPYVTFNGEGTVLFGDKTLKLNSAFDRINVRRLFITLESIIGSNAKRRLFEFNDQFSRAQFRNTVEPLLREVQGRRGIIEFKVICDESNNTPDIIDTNQFMADIYIKPNRSINYITLNFIASKSGISFKEINN